MSLALCFLMIGDDVVVAVVVVLASVRLGASFGPPLAGLLVDAAPFAGLGGVFGGVCD